MENAQITCKLLQNGLEMTAEKNRSECVQNATCLTMPHCVSGASVPTGSKCNDVWVEGRRLAGKSEQVESDK